MGWDAIRIAMGLAFRSQRAHENRSRVESSRVETRNETRRDETRIGKESRPENIIDRDMREETRSNYEKRVSRRKFIVIIHRKK